MKYPIFIMVVMVMVACSPQPDSITILHTNDTHSQIEPKSNGTGGYARRIGIIAAERAENENLILMDAGDFSQGSPYFNFFHGRVEIEAMNVMRYDVGTLGNHEFDNGIDTLAMLVQLADFPIVCANYNFSETALEGLIRPYTIIRRDGIKIGVFGIGVKPDGLITQKNFAPVQFMEPYPIAQQMADRLRNKEHCDVVVCLSHQGTYPGAEGDYSDVEMVAKTRNIDLVVCGHTHKVYDSLYVANLDGKDIPLVQAGKAGANIGKVTLHLSE